MLPVPFLEQLCLCPSCQNERGQFVVLLRSSRAGLEQTSLKVSYYGILMLGMRKAVFALVMALALFVQATASCMCTACPSGTNKHTALQMAVRDAHETGLCCCKPGLNRDDSRLGACRHERKEGCCKCDCASFTSNDPALLSGDAAHPASELAWEVLAVVPGSIELPEMLSLVQGPGCYRNDSGPPRHTTSTPCCPRAPPVANCPRAGRT